MYNPYQLGTWQQFVKRSDNKGLTTEQMRGKYLYEQYMFEQAMMQTIVPAVSAAAGGGGANNVDPSFNEFVEIDYIEGDYIE